MEKDKKEEDYQNGLIFLDKEIKEEFAKYKISQNGSMLADNILLLQDNDFKSVIFEKTLNSFLKTEISKDAWNKIKAKINITKNVTLNKCSHQDWFEIGFEMLKFKKNDKECPLCDSRLDNIDSLLNEYSNFFGEKFKKFQQDSISIKNDLIAIRNSVKKNVEIITNIKEIISRYSFSDLEDEIIDIEDYELKYFLSSVEELIRAIEEKTEDLDRDITEIDYEEIGRFDYGRDKHNEIIKEYREIQEELLTRLKESVFDERKTRKLFKKYFWEFLSSEIESFFDLKELSGLSFIKKTYDEKDKLSIILQGLETKKERELAKLKKESKFVNYYLKRLNINHFEIKTDDEDKFKDIEIIFTKIKQKKIGIKYSLSDGEKTALSFAYFLSKIRHEIIENQEDALDKYVIVIDDPISSLDENRLFSTALLIKEIFAKECKQLFVLSHNLVFLKFIGNILNNKNSERQDFFIEDGKISELPKLLQNYQTSYFHKIEKIQLFIEGEIDYESAKEFIPNHIRIVMEIFLSFKLWKLFRGSSSDKYRSAGLSDLVATLSGNSFENFAENDLINKDNLIDILSSIKNRVDPESHGTTQNITEINYLSKKELELIARQTIKIIDFLDQLHFKKIDNKIKNGGEE